MVHDLLVDTPGGEVPKAEDPVDDDLAVRHGWRRIED